MPAPAGGAPRRLVELYTRRVELADAGEGDLRYDLNVRAAEVFEKKLDDRREAIAALNAALDARPSDSAVLGGLERLYRAESLWDELLGNLQLQASAAETKEARVKLRTAIGDLYTEQLASPSDALEQYRLVLEDDATSDHAIRSARAIGEAHEELRLDAADILEPVLRGAGRHEDLVGVLEMRLRAQTDAEQRSKTLRAVALVEDEGRGRPIEAEAALLRALEDTPTTPRSTRRSSASPSATGSPATPTPSPPAPAPSSTPSSPRTSSFASARSPRRSSRTTAAASRPTPRPWSTRATRPSCSRPSTGSTVASATPRPSPTCSSGASRWWATIASRPISSTGSR